MIKLLDVVLTCTNQVAFQNWVVWGLDLPRELREHCPVKGVHLSPFLRVDGSTVLCCYLSMETASVHPSIWFGISRFSSASGTNPASSCPRCIGSKRCNLLHHTPWPMNDEQYVENQSFEDKLSYSPTCFGTQTPYASYPLCLLAALASVQRSPYKEHCL